MDFCNILLSFATGTILVGSSAGLKCWFCSTVLDPNCGDDKFTGETTLTVQKQNCSEVPSAVQAGAVNRTVPATACMKIKLDIQGATILFRTCASPGDYGVLNASSEGCTTIRSGAGEAYTCLCKDDYCNSATIQTMSKILVLISFINIIKIVLNSIK